MAGIQKIINFIQPQAIVYVQNVATTPILKTVENQVAY